MEQPASAPPRATDRPHRSTRAFVAVFLGAFILSGLLNLDAWPFTGWRLFSHLRQDHQVGWQAFTVDAQGRETQIAFSRFGRAYQGSPLILRGFPALPRPRQAELCELWEEAARHAGLDARAVRVYRVEWLESRRRGRREDEPLRTAGYECRHGSVSTIDPGSG